MPFSECYEAYSANILLYLSMQVAANALNAGIPVVWIGE